jgi:CheY-like chemotaxis protein
MAASPILVVDDDRDACASLSDVLADFGYRVDVAHGGVAALELVPAGGYGLALLDYKMPDMNGVELYRRICQTSSGVVGILVTAYAGGDTEEDALAAGVRKVIPKPVDLGRLLPLVEEAVGKPG